MEYAVYHYEVSQNVQTKLDIPDNVMKQHVENRYERFGRLFLKRTQMKLYQQKENDTEEYENFVMQTLRDVYVLQVNRNLYKTLYENTHQTENGIPKYEARKAKSLPLGHVIIDNREDRHLILIEKGTAWGKVPKALHELLQESLSRLLYDSYGLDITITAKMQPTEFVDFVNQQCRKNKDVVKRITIDYLNNGDKKGETPKGRGTLPLRAMSDYADKYNALKSTFSMEFQELHKEKIKHMVKLAQLCGEHNYVIAVKFGDYGIYHDKDVVVAFYQLADQAFSNFIAGQMVTGSDPKNGTFALLEWLEEVWKKTKDLEDGTKITRRKC